MQEKHFNGCDSAVIPRIFGAKISTSLSTQKDSEKSQLHSTLRFQKSLVLILILCSFGPYLAGSVRTEQLAVYSFAVIAAFSLLSTLRLSNRGIPLLLTWGFLLLVSLISSLVPVGEYFAWNQGSFLSGLDNYLLPFAVMLFMWTLIDKTNARPILQAGAKLVVWLSACNAILSIIQSQVDLNFVLRAFWASADNVGTTAENAARGLRYSGIFNQPAEVGSLYSIATVLAVWLYWRRPAVLYPLLTLIALGGVFAITKSYLYVGLPIGLIFLISKYKPVGKLITILAIPIIVFSLSQMRFLTEWGGLNRIGMLFEQVFDTGDGDRVSDLTAGRWNEDSSLREVMNAVWETRPIGGYGFAGLQVAYDSLWTEVMVQAGLLGILSIILTFVLLTFSSHQIENRDLRNLSFFLIVILIGASFGLPTITSNRVATIIWVILSLLILLSNNSSKTSTSKNSDKRQ